MDGSIATVAIIQFYPPCQSQLRELGYLMNLESR